MKVNTSDLPDVFVLLTEDRIILECKTEGGNWISCVLVPKEGRTTFRHLQSPHESDGEPIAEFLGESLEQCDAEIFLNGIKAVRLYATEILPSLREFNKLFRSPEKCPLDEAEVAVAGD
jgi:hypothetical protein